MRTALLKAAQVIGFYLICGGLFSFSNYVDVPTWVGIGLLVTGLIAYNSDLLSQSRWRGWAGDPDD